MLNRNSNLTLTIRFVFITALFYNSCTKNNTFIINEYEDKGCWEINFPVFDFRHIESNDTLILEVSCDNFQYDYNIVEQVKVPEKIYNTPHYYPNGVYYWRIIEKSTGNILETNELHYRENSGTIFNGIYLATHVDSGFAVQGEVYELKGRASCGLGIVIDDYYIGHSYSPWDIKNSKIIDDVLELDVTHSVDEPGCHICHYPGKIRIYLNENQCRLSFAVQRFSGGYDRSYSMEMRKI